MVCFGSRLIEFVAAEQAAKVNTTDPLIVDQFARGTFGELCPRVDDVGPITHSESLLHVVVGDQNGDACRRQTPDFGLEFFNGDRVDAAEWLVKKNQPRLGDQRSRDFQLASLAAGAGTRGIFGFMGEAELREKFRGAATTLIGRQVKRFKNREQVIFAREPLEDRRFLGEVPHSKPRPLIHGEPGDIVTVEDHAPRIRIDHPDRHPKTGGLTRAITPQKPDDLPSFHVKRDRIDDQAAGIGLTKIVCFKQGHERQFRRAAASPRLSHAGCNIRSCPTV